MKGRFTVKKFLANALALAISSIPYGMLIEIVIWGYTFLQSVSVRLEGIPIDLALGGWYGLWRARVLLRMGAKEGNWAWRWFCGSVAFTTFNIPLYLIALFVSWLWVPVAKRATPWEITMACITLIATAPIGDKLFEWFALLFHRLFRVPEDTP